MTRILLAVIGLIAVVFLGKWWYRAPDQSLATLRAHDGPVRGVACSDDGATIASVGDDGQAYLWDAASDSLIRNWSAHGGRVRAVAFGSGGTLITAADDHTVKIWQADSGREVAKLDAGAKAVECVAARGPYIAAGGVDKLIRIWSAEGKLLHSLAGHTKHVHAVAFNATGKLLASGGSGGVIRLWDPASGKSLGTITAKGGHVESLAFLADGKTLMAAGSGMGVKLFDTTRLTARPFDGASPGTTGAAMSADSQRFASVHEDGLVRVWDAVEGKLQTSLQGHHCGVVAVVFLPNGRIVTGGADGLLKIWSVQ